MEWMNDLLLALHQTECCGIRAAIVEIGDLHRRKREGRQDVHLVDHGDGAGESEINREDLVGSRED